MKTTKQMIEVMKAFEDGKEIECSVKEQNRWTINTNPVWNWREFDYRIREEPKKMKTVYEWMLCDRDLWFIANQLQTEQEAKENYSNYKEYKKTGRSWEVEV